MGAEKGKNREMDAEKGNKMRSVCRKGLKMRSECRKGLNNEIWVQKMGISWVLRKKGY